MSAKIKTLIYLIFISLSLSAFATGAEFIEIFQNETRILKFEDLSRMAVGNPEIADVTMFPEASEEALLNGKKPGATTLTIWKKNGETKTYVVHVSGSGGELERANYPLKHYSLTKTDYDSKSAQIVTKIDDQSVENLRLMLTPILGEKNFSIDSGRNRVLMQGTRSDLDSAEAMLTMADEPLRQVMIEAKVIEITKGDLKKMGVSLLAQQNETRGSTMGGADGDSMNVTFDTFTDLARRFNITVDALRKENVGRTLVNPKIAALDGKTAWILAGEKLPVASRDSEKGLVSYTYINTGIILAVTPRVGRDRSITLWLKPEVSNVTGWVGDPNAAMSSAAPIIGTREVMSEIRVNDGESVIIGGLQKEYETTMRDKVPMLGDLPVVGSAFRKKRTESETSELIIVITPHIMDSPTTVGSAKDEPETVGSAAEPAKETPMAGEPARPMEKLEKKSLLSIAEIVEVATANVVFAPQAVEGE